MNLNVLQNESFPLINISSYKLGRNSHGKILALSFLRGDMNILDECHPEIKMKRAGMMKSVCVEMCVIVQRFVM